MKKFISLLLALSFVLALFGCSNADIENELSEPTDNTNPKPSGTYSFSGENEIIKISNGYIVYSETDELFSGGNLEILQADAFANVRSYSATFYTFLNNGERNDFHSTNVTGVRDGATSISGDLGNSSSNGFMVVNLEQGLWFELKTTSVNGTENVYLLELTVIEN